MPWDVRVVDERGKAIISHDVGLEFRVLENLPDSAVLLKGIDRYQDTTFNNLQLERFVEEWHEHMSSITDPEDSRACEQVRDFAQQCLGHPHWYLKFIGD